MGACGESLINLLAIVAYDILYVVVVLEATLNLKGHYAGVDKFANACREVEILYREQVFALYNLFPAARYKVVCQSAGL